MDYAVSPKAARLDFILILLAFPLRFLDSLTGYSLGTLLAGAWSIE